MFHEETEAPVVADVPAQAKTVRVELVWPVERGAKIDCRGDTKIVWTGKGDVQDYPADQWHKLAAHPDVWRLVDPKDANTATRAGLFVPETPEARVERLNLDAKAKATEVERVRRLKQHGAQTNTDVVVVSTPLDAEQLAEMSDEDVHAEGHKRHYALHPRLTPVNLRARFLELQAAEADTD